jgi:hypothetical protein
MVQPFTHTWIYVSFKLNQNYISKALCIQKDAEVNTCKGCCQLKKELAKSEDHEQKEIPFNKTKVELSVYHCPDFHNFRFKNHLTLQGNYSISRIHFLPSANLSGIFRPPKIG